MAAQGSINLNFGAFPGALQAQAVVGSQTGILSTSLVEAWLYPVATADHSVDEQIFDSTSLIVTAANIVPGTGFTIYGQVDLGNAPLYGNYNIAWVWN
jgi:hypothetical protein